MTELAVDGTTSDSDDEQRRRRLEQLQRRRPNRSVTETLPAAATELGRQIHRTPRATARRTRAHPAIGARVGAAGIGLATMLGLVGAMGMTQPSTASSAATPVVTAPTQVIVVLHRTSASPTTAAAAPSTSAAPARDPIALTARPTVRAAAPAQAQAQATPTARTNGSR